VLKLYGLDIKNASAAPEAGREGGGALVMRGLEFGASGLVLLFGLGLLFGSSPPSG
jgi:nickel/cobalt exporter